MYDHDPIKDLGLSCPSGGDFYICNNDPQRFIGCCDTNPCGARKGLCPDQHIKPASFNETLQHEFLPQACINDNADVKWYTCSETTPPFLGCCAVDPCVVGTCPRKELRAAKLSGKTNNVEDFLGGGSDYDPKPVPATDTDTDTDTGSVSRTTASPGATSTFEGSDVISSFITSLTMESTMGTITSIAATSTSELTLESSPKLKNDNSDGGRSGMYALFVLLILPITFIIWITPKARRWLRRRKDAKAEQAREAQEREDLVSGQNQYAQQHPRAGWTKVQRVSSGEIQRVRERTPIKIRNRTTRDTQHRARNLGPTDPFPLIQAARDAQSHEFDGTSGNHTDVTNLPELGPPMTQEQQRQPSSDHSQTEAMGPPISEDDIRDATGSYFIIDWHKLGSTCTQ
ncbi:hypothetical protein F53441_5454 [Fusarium austroafricanum]|uniref:Uncharacterized protein n=1 Tax=Fusarium austroafricanum TaxID=2364996 RepID=A0A8H4KKW8_9HYPO|nr:hypothetical protein F53441_5454 [Fusarium austroafricanum]